jgi:O-antigen ligase/polysaccharide polymerase Wzy-like membrane protein
MTDLAIAAGTEPPAQTAPGIRTLQLRLLWLVGACGSIVFLEPSPYEVALVLAVVVFFATGVRLAPVLQVPLLLLTGINLGYSIGALELFGDPVVLSWILTSWYMAAAAIFFALVLSQDTAERLDALSRGYLVAAVIASLAAIAGYFNLIPGGADLLTYVGRARGTFKDPNVLGAFLIFPALYALQGTLEGSLRSALRNAIVFGILSLAIFLAFSRAAWGTLAGSALLMVALMFITAASPQKRFRIVMLTLVAVVLAIAAVAALLSFDSIDNLFKERASFNQPYDSGRFGRFGRHLLGAAMALDYPLGIGPLQFRHFFPEDTHNSFLNAFMSGGWLSGILYPVLIFTTAIYSARNVLLRTPWQRTYIPVFSTLFVTILESFIIDTDHWRHYYLLLGVTWGIAVASGRWRNEDVAGLAAGSDAG